MQSLPVSVCPTKEELDERRLSPQNLEIAIRSLYHDGLVVIENALPHGLLDHINERMIQDALTLQSRKESGPYNYNRGNIQQDPPPVREYFHKEIFLSMF